jgi:broad specificity phosphatase PhoE
MCKKRTIHIFRHAEAVHNLSPTNPHIQCVRDSPLTPHGIQQAKEILMSPSVSNFRKPTLVICSPLIRCLHTALYAFHPDFNELLKNVLETGKDPCGEGLALKNIHTIFKDGNVKFMADPRLLEVNFYEDTEGNQPTALNELPREIRKIFEFPPDLFPETPLASWLNRSGQYSDYSDFTLVTRRVKSFFYDLSTRPEEEIIIVTHGGLFQSYISPDCDLWIPNAHGYSFKFFWEGEENTFELEEIEGNQASS